MAGDQEGEETLLFQPRADDQVMTAAALWDEWTGIPDVRGTFCFAPKPSEFYLLAFMPVVMVRSEGHRRSSPNACASRRFLCPCDHAGGARPVASDRALPMVGAHVASTCGDDPSRRQPPSRLRPGFAFAASHGRQSDARRRRLSDRCARTHTTLEIRRALVAGSPLPAVIASVRNTHR
jgi:hypothetical protein